MVWQYSWERSAQDKTATKPKRKKVDWRAEVAAVLQSFASLTLTENSILSINLVKKIRDNSTALEIAKCNRDGAPYSTMYVPLEVTPSLLLAVAQAYTVLAKERGRLLEAEHKLLGILQTLDRDSVPSFAQKEDTQNTQTVPNPAKPKRK
jgi:hypothetical protein